MNRTHGGLTVAVPIKEGSSCALRKTLRDLNRTHGTGRDLNRTHGQGPAGFDRADTVLFVSGVILPAQPYHGEMLPETFVLASTYCGPLSAHLDDLIDTHAGCLIQLFQHCEPSPTGPDELKRYLCKNSYSSTFSSRYQCMTKAEVAGERQLRDEIHRYLARAQALDAFDSLTALQVKTLIQRHIRIHEDRFHWAFKPAKGMSLAEFWIFHRAKWVAFALLFLADWLLFRGLTPICFIGKALLWDTVAAVTLVGTALGWTGLVVRDRHPPTERPSDEEVRKIAASQLHPVLNEMTAAVPLKKGRLRRWYYGLALSVIRTFLPNLDVPTVSSIRWLVTDKGKRLIFLSNFSNMTDFYVRDFLNDKTTAQGINFMFTNGQFFPDAGIFFLSGIRKDPEGYMNAVHRGQHVTDFWYAHEPMLTQDIIQKFRRLRNGLFTEMNEE